jgi:hypothetical protein
MISTAASGVSSASARQVASWLGVSLLAAASISSPINTAIGG